MLSPDKSRVFCESSLSGKSVDVADLSDNSGSVDIANALNGSEGLGYGAKRHSIIFCVKANPIRQRVACEASMIWDFLLIAWFPWAETVCAPQA